MVRQDFDTERLRALRAEVEQQTSLLPAVLQSSNCVALVDHLASVFKHDDWTSAAKCSQWSAEPEAAESSGWSTFQSLLRQETQPSKSQAELRAMDIAHTEMHTNIRSIQETTCLPSTRLAALASTLCTDNGGSLELARCTVCHSLLLTTAFDDHLPRCRPCDPTSVRPRSSTPQPRQGSKAGLNAKGAKGSKKGKGRGSSKPPAGPSRFAIEQAKSAYQTAFASTVHRQPALQKPQHPMQYPSQAPPLLQCDSVPIMQAKQAWPTSNVQQPAVLDSHQGNGTVSTSAGDMAHAPQPQSMQRPRSAWTYDPGLSRSNPDVDAVHDPSLPPRFPKNVTRSRRKRILSVEPEKPALHGSNAHADQKERDASRLDASAKAINALGNRQLHLGQRQSDANVLAPTAKRLKQASSAPDGTAEGPHDLWQHKPDTSGQLQSNQSNAAQPSALHRHPIQSSHLGHNPAQNGHHAHAEGMLHDSSINSSAAYPRIQHHNARQTLPSQPAWSRIPSSDHHAQPGQIQRLQQPPASSHRSKQPVNAVAAGRMSLPYANGAAVTHLSGHAQHQSHVPTMWSPVNGYRTMHGSEGASAHRARSGGWHMPDSKRQVSVNALARSSYGS